MSDTRTRELQREAKQGDTAAQARLLAERVRAGELESPRLELAASLGHLPARELLGTKAPAIPSEGEAWLDALETFGTEVLSRAACSSGWLLLPAWEAFRPADVLAEAILRMDCRYLLDPMTREARVGADELLSQAGLPPGEGDEDSEEGSAVLRALGALFEAQGPGVLRSNAFLRLLARLSFAGNRFPPRHAVLRDTLTIAIETAGLGQVQRWMRRELVPWALGEGDPLRMRVAKRGEVDLSPGDLAE